ncbi:elongin-A isoform X1 [Takifugu rubripes]|uniref:Elongin A n=1 Tax=Takifugu rubripes TaxID=31033 RepID=H2SBK4_TAKRU|nr:elongin-A isoform X1 [Takifugu rubripes]
MAEELLETVERLQSRLLDNTEHRKLLKTFKRLAELPMTVEILVETGVGKTVNSFRKHEVVGEAAKSLVGQWKKLVPQSVERPTNSHVREPAQSHTYSRGQEPGGGHYRSTREPSPEEESCYMEQEEEQEYHANYSPSPPPQEQYSSPQRRGYHSDEYESLEPDSSPPPPPPPSHKDVRYAKSNRESSKRHHHSDQKRDRNEDQLQHSAKMSGDRSVEGKKNSMQKTSKQNKKSTTHQRKVEEKKKKEEGRPQMSKDSSSKEEEDDFETPTMSFESFLTYDAPTSVKKKKKLSSSLSSSSTSHSRPSHSTTTHHKSTPPPVPSSTSSSSKVNKANGNKRPRSDSVAATSQKRKRQVVEALPVLPEIPLPAIQPNYRPLPSIDVTPLSPQRRKVPFCNEEEDVGFTGKRLNSKMVVFSGSKTSYLPRMMTLYEQCIRVLQNNIDSIAEVGGVPFEILEPVLERCTPEQLYRIEQSNQWFTEDSDELWMRHCQRDFKRETPQEYESWRELYLRLHDEREERLRLLTQNISSAHANKPKGRQVKMAFVNSVAKPPRDVRRRQEKFGTTGGLSTATSTVAASPIKIRPASTDYASDLSQPTSSHQNLSSNSSSRSIIPAGGAVSAARDKPQVKKIAPMMAKTIKAFKNRFSRR